MPGSSMRPRTDGPGPRSFAALGCRPPAPPLGCRPAGPLLPHFRTLVLSHSRTEMSEYSNLLLEVQDRVATLTVNRPDKLNALNEQTIRELSRAVDEITTRDDIGG